MKRMILCVLVVVLLCGCGQRDEWASVLQIRQNLLQSDGCTFDAHITADYGQTLSQFSAMCSADREGSVTFTISGPQTIAGITGGISQHGGKLTFDDTVLAFELLAEGRLSPVAAPWVLINALRSGYLHSYQTLQDGLLLLVNDSYEDNALQLQIKIDTNDLPSSAEIYWQERRILTIQVENFRLL